MDSFVSLQMFWVKYSDIGHVFPLFLVVKTHARYIFYYPYTSSVKEILNELS